MSDDLELARLTRDARDLSTPDAPGSGPRSFFGRVTTAAPAVGQFLKVVPQAILGAEVEGGSATISDLGSTALPVYLVGPGVPATGDQVVSRLVDYRWITRLRDTGAPGTVSACGCTGIPTTLNVSANYQHAVDVGGVACPGAPSGTATVTVSATTFTIAHTNGPVTIGGGTSVRDYWFSGCVSLLDGETCFCAAPLSTPHDCYRRYLFYCASGTWRITRQSFDTLAACSAATATSISWQIGGAMTGTCSPFAWNDAFPAGANGSQVTG